MLIDSVTLVDGNIDDGVIESAATLPDISTAKLGQVFYLSAQDGSNGPGLYTFDGTVWKPSSGSTPVDETTLWMGA